MTRIALRLLVAVALVAMGWSIRLAQDKFGPDAIFKLKIDAPTGSTTVRCDGCQFLSWKDGHSSVSSEVTLACGGPQSCFHAIGVVKAGPLQMAGNSVYSE